MRHTEYETFGDLVLALRRAAGHTQEQMAEAINAASGRDTVTRREISRYETNRTVPAPHMVERIALACGLPPERLERAARQARATRGRSAQQPSEGVPRRSLVGGGLLGAATAAEPWGRLAHALGRGRPVDKDATAALTERAEQLHISEHHLTAQQLRGHVEAHLDALTAALPHARGQQLELTVAAGETAALAGWVAWDAGDHVAARAYYRVAVDCADAAGHPPLRSLAYGYASYGAAPDKALGLLGQAAAHVRGPGNATAAAWVHARYAEVAATVQDATAALRALDRARTAYEYADHGTEQSWVRFMSPGRMDSFTISVLGSLAHPELQEAAAAATRGLGDTLPEAGVVVLGDIATALLRTGDLDHGVHVARQFATAAANRPNTMGRERAVAIATALPQRESDLAGRLTALAG